MIRRPPRSTLSSSSAASDVYKRQVSTQSTGYQRRVRGSVRSSMRGLALTTLLLLAHNSLALPLLDNPGPRDPGVYSELVYHQLCGVIGGVGPAATVDFFNSVVTGQTALFNALQRAALQGANYSEQLQVALNTSSANWSFSEVRRLSTFPNDIRRMHMDDQHHVPLVVYDDPQIPDRTEWILYHHNATPSPLDPRPLLIRTANRLVSAGANCVCVICNTAHFFLPTLKAALPSGTRLLNMLELTVQAGLRVRRNQTGTLLNLGLLATAGTVETGIYQQAAQSVTNQSGVEVRVFSPVNVSGGNQSSVMEAIYGVKGIKAGYVSMSTPQGRQNFQLLYAQARLLVDGGAEFVVAGCTEIPLVLTQEAVDAATRSGQKRVVLLNPTRILADEVVRLELVNRTLPP
eukprot:TRINITY_DN60094_c0_g2_i2.p1 TRINITY_DN60094_c0_g2~~TRINITY_DN60094_c0_g2_i2.p1  ORF type:complete len:404 (+),score=59.05 TRINITY_DN60094_c0_g2_i2:146-1357(+)